jgi:hypothetical protein
MFASAPEKSSYLTLVHQLTEQTLAVSGPPFNGRNKESWKSAKAMGE